MERHDPERTELLSLSRSLAAVAALLAGACQVAETPRLHPRPGVVSLHEVTSEIVVALGAKQNLLGVSEPADPTPELSRALAAVPRVESLEAIVALRPELVLGLHVVAERDPELVARLREMGVDVYLANPSSPDDVLHMVRDVAARVKTVEAGDALIGSLKARFAGFESAGRSTRVFVYDCCDPPFTAGKHAIVTELLARTGARNVFDELDADFAHVSWEEVVARRPEHVVVHTYELDGQADQEGKLRALRALPSLSGLPVTFVPLACSLGGLRSPEGLERLRASFGEES
jgi:ABC-type hemin transport system substrate-binding protein